MLELPGVILYQIHSEEDHECLVQSGPEVNAFRLHLNPIRGGARRTSL
jgi:hypothetical protein